ncbi:hypothetical protein [Shimazuella alba]|uniref:Uncharacterized protein n=1 Tax=Shimazuella alba TaxID=2690964 RepID=A0A6I4VQH3_9BACL|nr:hypothetical protein [Shimazuella alba]MXQ53333.1 hypothetical protein [Shimazuella alba]
MKVKKVGVSLLASAFVLATPFTAFAALTYKGNYSFNYNSNRTAYVTKVISTDGGDFKICPSTLVTKSYDLYEYDPDNADDYIGSAWLSTGDCYTFKNLGNYEPGSNPPEVYVKTSTYQAYGSSVKVYD